MNEYLLFNTRFYKSDAPLVQADNQGLRYGSGLFETIRYANGKLCLADWHFERLFNGLNLLGFELPAYFKPGYLSDQVSSLCKKNQHKTARIRINVFKGNGGIYDGDNSPNCIIQSWKLPEAEFQLNENGLVTGIYNDARKPQDVFSNLKSNNYLLYSMAALYAKKQLLNDAFLLNTSGAVCDATIANIFIVKNDVIYTPPLQAGCVAGIMRRFVMKEGPNHGFDVREKELSREELLAADEVFLTNAIKAIRWVHHCQDSVYTNKLTKAIFRELFKK